MNNSFLNNIALLLIFTLTACNLNASDNQNNNLNTNSKEVENSSIEIMEVAEHQVFCEQMVPRKCLYVKREGKKGFRALWDNIENFEYISGYKYKLRVEVQRNPRPAKDTSGFKYFLKEIVSREKVEVDKVSNLYLSKWYLTHIKGKKVENAKPYLVFKKSDKGFYGRTGCNSLSGQYLLDGNSIELSRMRMTKRACPNMQNIETSFTQKLKEADEIEAQKDRLYFKNNGVVLLEFKSNWS